MTLLSKVHWFPFPRTSSLLHTCKCLQEPDLCAEKKASAPDSVADLPGDARHVAHSLTQPPLDFLVLQKRNQGPGSGVSSPKQKSSASPDHPLVCAEIVTFPKKWWFQFDHLGGTTAQTPQVASFPPSCCAEGWRLPWPAPKTTHSHQRH